MILVLINIYLFNIYKSIKILVYRVLNNEAHVLPYIAVSHLIDILGNRYHISSFETFL